MSEIALRRKYEYDPKGKSRTAAAVLLAHGLLCEDLCPDEIKAGLKGLAMQGRRRGAASPVLVDVLVDVSGSRAYVPTEEFFDMAWRAGLATQDGPWFSRAAADGSFSRTGADGGRVMLSASYASLLEALVYPTPCPGATVPDLTPSQAHAEEFFAGVGSFRHAPRAGLAALYGLFVGAGPWGVQVGGVAVATCGDPADPAPWVKAWLRVDPAHPEALREIRGEPSVHRGAFAVTMDGVTPLRPEGRTTVAVPIGAELPRGDGSGADDRAPMVIALVGRPTGPMSNMQVPSFDGEEVRPYITRGDIVCVSTESAGWKLRCPRLLPGEVTPPTPHDVATDAHRAPPRRDGTPEHYVTPEARGARSPFDPWHRAPSRERWASFNLPDEAGFGGMPLRVFVGVDLDGCVHLAPVPETRISVSADGQGDLGNLQSAQVEYARRYYEPFDEAYLHDAWARRRNLDELARLHTEIAQALGAVRSRLALGIAGPDWARESDGKWTAAGVARFQAIQAIRAATGASLRNAALLMERDRLSALLALDRVSERVDLAWSVALGASLPACRSARNEVVGWCADFMGDEPKTETNMASLSAFQAMVTTRAMAALYLPLISPASASAGGPSSLRAGDWPEFGRRCFELLTPVIRAELGGHLVPLDGAALVLPFEFGAGSALSQVDRLARSGAWNAGDEGRPGGRERDGSDPVAVVLRRATYGPGCHPRGGLALSDLAHKEDDRPLRPAGRIEWEHAAPPGRGLLPYAVEELPGGGCRVYELVEVADVTTLDEASHLVVDMENDNRRTQDD